MRETERENKERDTLFPREPFIFFLFPPTETGGIVNFPADI